VIVVGERRTLTGLIFLLETLSIGTPAASAGGIAYGPVAVSCVACPVCPDPLPEALGLQQALWAVEALGALGALGALPFMVEEPGGVDGTADGVGTGDGANADPESDGGEPDTPLAMAATIPAAALATMLVELDARCRDFAAFGFGEGDEDFGAGSLAGGVVGCADAGVDCCGG